MHDFTDKTSVPNTTGIRRSTYYCAISKQKTTHISSVAARLPPSSANCPPTVQANCAASLFSDDVSLCVSSLVTARSSPSQLTMFGMWTHRRRSQCVSGAGQVSNDWRCWHALLGAIIQTDSCITRRGRWGFVLRSGVSQRLCDRGGERGRHRGGRERWLAGWP